MYLPARWNTVLWPGPWLPRDTHAHDRRNICCKLICNTGCCMHHLSSAPPEERIDIRPERLLRIKVLLRGTSCRKTFLLFHAGRRQVTPTNVLIEVKVSIATTLRRRAPATRTREGFGRRECRTEEAKSCPGRSMLSKAIFIPPWCDILRHSEASQRECSCDIGNLLEWPSLCLAAKRERLCPWHFPYVYDAPVSEGLDITSWL